ncbi:MAG: type III pantothenate kinase [Planctomycetota bacterium]
MTHLITADCGNSRAHIALIDLDRLPDPGSAPDPAAPWPGADAAIGPVFGVTNRGLRDALDDAWMTLPDADRQREVAAVVIGSVNPLGDEAVADWAATSEAFAARPRRPTAFRLRRDLPIPIANLTRRPDQVGQDRLLNALACRFRYPGRGAIVVDFGSAITFDIVSPAGEYLGGVIAPGLSLALNALHERTALLPLVRPRGGERPPVLGTDTESAILSGVYHGFPGLVLGILERLSAEVFASSPPLVIATGGDAHTLVDELPAGTFHATLPEITHEGIALSWLAAGRPV